MIIPPKKAPIMHPTIKVESIGQWISFLSKKTLPPFEASWTTAWTGIIANGGRNDAKKLKRIIPPPMPKIAEISEVEKLAKTDKIIKRFSLIKINSFIL